jgi:squalene-hopene/tetraprenyl-beta-curcumene cyclase
MMFDALGLPPDDPRRAVARKSIDKLLVVKDGEAYCQPCVSPVWDTALAAHALLETGGPTNIASAQRGLDWLLPRQELEVKGDWAFKRPDVRPGGWAFQYANPHYPDLDDTAVIVVGMARAQKESGARTFDPAMARAREWIEGLQSSDSGWGAFDADNTHEFLNNIPFADHGALLDPPSPDLTARCLSMLAQLGATMENSPAMRGGVAYLRRTQLRDGSWYGRWGINYIYGTWSALCALNAAGLPHDAPEIKRAAEWLISIQNEDGGWGEDGDSYRLDYRGHEKSVSTPSQTAWALLGLMAAGEAQHEAVKRGVDYLLGKQETDGLWSERDYTGTGFPRVFYLRYHGYPKFFPLWALARYRNLKSINSRRVSVAL